MNVWSFLPHTGFEPWTWRLLLTRKWITVRFGRGYCSSLATKTTTPATDLPSIGLKSSLPHTRFSPRFYYYFFLCSAIIGLPSEQIVRLFFCLFLFIKEKVFGKNIWGGNWQKLFYYLNGDCDNCDNYYWKKLSTLAPE